MKTLTRDGGPAVCRSGTPVTFTDAPPRYFRGTYGREERAMADEKLQDRYEQIRDGWKQAAPQDQRAMATELDDMLVDDFVVMSDERHEIASLSLEIKNELGNRLTGR